MSLELKRFLLNSYGSFVHKGVRGNREDHVFKIDDAERSDKGSISCHIYVTVTGLDQFQLHLTNSPMNDEMEQLFQSKGAEIRAKDSHCDVSLTLETSDHQFVLQISGLLQHMVPPARSHYDRNDARTCSPTADSLRRFAGLLRQYERQTCGIEKTRPDGLFAF